MTLVEFINKVVDIDELNDLRDLKNVEDVSMDWQHNYKQYVSFRSQTYDKAYSLLKYINRTFKKYDVLPSFSYFDTYGSKYLTEEELLSGLWVLILVYRTVSDLDVNKIKQCPVVDSVEVIKAISDVKKMYIVKIKYFIDRFDIEETEGDEEDECR